ncbi:MAG: Uma2 family endonuclease [Anaerolineae bacterium]|nr:Uma2 family endonuclease [Anaerolineae bacterium]
MAATLTIPAPATLPAGQIVATGVSAEEYLARYAEEFHEWVRGAVIKMSPVSALHDLLTHYLRFLLDTYLELHPIGKAISAPFVMRLETTGSFREPDVQVILNGNPGKLTDTAMIGPADICIEVVSPESAKRDLGDKFVEYETAGVREYWIVDPLRRDARFYRRGTDKLYAPAHPDDSGAYQTPLLPGLRLHVPTLWGKTLPTRVETVQAVQAMLSGE